MDRTRLATVRSLAQRVLCAVSVWLCLWAPLRSRAQSSVSKTPISSNTAPTPATSARFVFADPYPSPPGPVDEDLLGGLLLETRSEALLWFTLGTIAEERGETDKASDFLRKSLQLDPGNVALASRLASEHVQKQEHAEALRLLKDAAQARPNRPEPFAEIARVYLDALRQPDNALPYAEKAYKMAPARYPVLSVYVETCAAGRLSQRVEDTLKRTLTLSNTDPGFWLSSGDLFRNAFALRSPAPPKSVSERVDSLFAKALELAPRDVRCLEKTADHYAISGRLPEARVLYQRANSLHRELFRSHSAGVCQKLARVAALENDLNGALEVLEDLFQEQPLIPQARELAGSLYLQTGQLVLALGHLKLALEMDPRDLDDALRVLQLQLQLRRPAEAIQTAQYVQKWFPDSPNLTLLLAMALSEAKRPQEAVEAFEKAERQYSGTQKEALDAGFYLSFGAAAERAGLFEKSEQLLKKSIALDPQNAAEALNYLGYMWIEANQRLDEAGELIKRALALRPDHPAYLDSLGWWHYRKGQWKEAEEQLRRALRTMRREEAGEVYDHLGDVLEKFERPDEALAAWDAAAELDPSLVRAREKAARLRTHTPTDSDQ
ncbi:MAG: hypothetical protein RLZZ399_1455 [Verrucomicrobiota bacterium]